jgi:biotin transport system substrate-specific component
VALVVAGSLIVAASAQVAIPLLSGVPITGQTFAVLLVGSLLGARRGAAALTLYMMEGACGLPVFAQFGAGLPLLSAGYIVGFIPAAALAGALAQRGWDRRVGTTLAAMTVATAVIFAAGLVWLFAVALFMNSFVSGTDGIAPSAVLMVGLVPFLPGAVIKIGLAAALLPAAWRLPGVRDWR